MAIHLHRHDDTGLWSCGGPYPSIADALSEAKRIIKTREEKAGEKWRETTPSEGFTHAWVNTKNHRLEIKNG